jgi:hypothetical protein
VRALTPDRSLLSALVAGRFLADVDGHQRDIVPRAGSLTSSRLFSSDLLNRRPRPASQLLRTADSDVGHHGSLASGYRRTVAHVFRPQRPVRTSGLLASSSPHYAATTGRLGQSQPRVGASRGLQNRLWGGAEPSQVGSIPIHPTRAFSEDLPRLI